MSMKINLYYGGRGLIDDPTLYVIGVMQEVLEELNVRVERYNLYEIKNTIASLPQTIKEADGLILASSVEWHGIGGYMQTFLDAIWLYGDKEKISETYMCPIVMSTAYGEKEGRIHLESAWEILGGKLCDGISGYIQDVSLLEKNDQYQYLIEKKAENLYRTINQKTCNLPSSARTVMQTFSVRPNSDLTPQETEQLSQYVSDDSYMQRSKEDIQELVNYFRERLDETDHSDDIEYIDKFRTHFHPQPGIRANYQFQIEGKKKNLCIQVDVSALHCYYGGIDGKVDVEISMTKKILEDILEGRLTFQRAFMAGNMKMRGDFKLLRVLDLVFVFMED